jgi:hypothetical protein
MACCGLCRPKMKPKVKTHKNITTKKVNTIEMWMENIEGPYEPIILPSKSPNKPKTITNKEEIAEAEANYHSSNSSMLTEEDDKTSQYDNMTLHQKMESKKQNFQYLSSELSINEDIQ